MELRRQIRRLEISGEGQCRGSIQNHADRRITLAGEFSLCRMAFAGGQVRTQGERGIAIGHHAA